MTAFALISGRVFRDPERKISKAGKPFVAAKLREGAGDSDVWWSVVAFADNVREELSRLRAIAVSGPFTVSTYERHGEIRLNHSIIAERLISAHRQRKRRPEDERTLTYEGAP